MDKKWDKHTIGFLVAGLCTFLPSAVAKDPHTWGSQLAHLRCASASYHLIEIGSKKYKLLRLENTPGDPGGRYLVLTDEKGNTVTLSHTCNEQITAILDEQGNLHFFRNTEGKKIEASIPDELTPSGRINYVSRSEGGLGSSAIQTLFSEDRTIVVEDSMLQYRFIYDAVAERVVIVEN